MAMASAAQKPKPGVPIKPFCDAPMTTLARSASMPNGVAPREATTSTTNRAGWPTSSIALRMATRSLVIPLAVSVCTVNTALIWWPASACRTAWISAGSSGKPSTHGVRTTTAPKASVCTAQDSEKCPVPGISTLSPMASKFTLAASQAPWPLAAYIKTSAACVPSNFLSPVSQAVTRAGSRGSPWSSGCRLMASSTAWCKCVGPGACKKRWPGMCANELMLGIVSKNEVG